MDFQKVENLFDSASEFTKICYQKMDWSLWFYDQSEKNCNVNKEIRIKTPMLRSDLFAF